VNKKNISWLKTFLCVKEFANKKKHKIGEIFGDMLKKKRTK
jgi:hypothetical protein